MENESPPKRVTRSRAAAKATEPGPPKMKIATAASKAKTTRAAATGATVSTSTKRKTRADDAHDEDEQPDEEETSEEPMEKKKSEPARTTRGRAKKPAQEEQQSVAQDALPEVAHNTRGRPKKAATEGPAPEPTRTTRGRPKKVDTADAAEEPAVASAAEPMKKPVRGGRIATTKAPVAAKKNVAFEEKHDMDKENKLPTRAIRGKAKVAEEPTGLRAKPLRRPAAAASAATTTAAPRATRGRAKTVTPEQTDVSEQSEAPAQKSSPLSPKKVTQIATATEPFDDDDELSTMHKTPMKSLTRSPVKPPGSILDPAKRLDFTASITVNRLTTEMNTSLLRSPARKAPQSAFLDMNSPARKAPQSEYKDSMKESPRKLNLGDSLLHAPFKASAAGTSNSNHSSFKASLLQSPARRPPSPMKAAELNYAENGTSMTVGATPKVSQFKISRFTTPKTTSKSMFKIAQPVGGSIVRPNTAAATRFTTANASRSLNFPTSTFPGRLSAIVPRELDPAASPAKVETTEKDQEAYEPPSMKEELATNEENVPDEGPAEEAIVEDDPMLATESEKFNEEIALFQSSARSTTPPSPPLYANNPLFELRPELEDPFQDSDSEDELASSSIKYSPALLSPLNVESRESDKMPKTPRAFSNYNGNTLSQSSARNGTIRAQRQQQIGFTPLARQLSDWMAASPEKRDSDSESGSEQASPVKGFNAEVEQSPSKGGFFEDEMSVRDNENLIEDAMDVDGEVVMNEVELDEEDMALAAEADEMSLIGPVEIENTVDTEEKLETSNEEDVMGSPTRSVSDCSQEYGDENDMHIDPQLLSLDAQLPQTPVAVQPRTYFERVSHTVSKVPLKPAADDTPVKYSPMKRSASVSRIPNQRGDISAEIDSFSFSPTKQALKSRQDQPLEEILDEITTPRSSKVAATPARRELDGQLLKGAVVYVDVHTIEGADASGIFVELLTQMGAKCVKTWTWNPNHSSPESDGSPNLNKIGITHVVFKDGGKRTLEKVRESNGIVLCIGVGWVLDCERENAWLDESLYAVDTTLIPRGGHKRRKSMEPRALANLNGVLVPSLTPGRPTMSPAKQFRNLETPKTNNRRASREWVRSPSHSSPEELAALEALEQDLLPIPATPAPVSAYSESLLDDDDGESSTPYFLHPKDLVQMTCPPKKTGKPYEGLDSDDLPKKREDGGVMARLMMARRKSLQFAPKVGSPLARGTNWET